MAIVQLLIVYHADVNYVDELRINAIMHLCLWYKNDNLLILAIVQLLVDCGMNVNQRRFRCDGAVVSPSVG